LNNINPVREEITIPLNGLTDLPLNTDIRSAVRIGNITPKVGTFASLGHIFDYTSLDSTQDESNELVKEEATKELSIQNFPNPFNPSTKFNVNIPKEALVSLKIYDILGREVKTIVNNKLNAGTYEFLFDAQSYPSGVYLYQLELEGEKPVSKKMLLVK
jgi:hypothetical protein